MLDALGAPLSSDRAAARTGIVGDQARAGTSLSGLKVGSLPALAPVLPQVPLPPGLDALPIPLGPGAALLGLPALISVDATEAARKLVTERALPDVPVMAADLVRTGVAAACQTGRLVFDSLAAVEGLTALGRDLPTDRAIDTAVPLAAAQTVDFSALDIAAIELPGGLSLANPLTGPVLRSALAVRGRRAAIGLGPRRDRRVTVEPARRENGHGRPAPVRAARARVGARPRAPRRDAR